MLHRVRAYGPVRDSSPPEWPLRTQFPSYLIGLEILNLANSFMYQHFFRPDRFVNLWGRNILSGVDDYHWALRFIND